MLDSKIALGRKKNTLLRYQDILIDFQNYKTEDIPTTVIWRKYIYPKYHISRTTLYTILATPVKKELKKVSQKQLTLF